MSDVLQLKDISKTYGQNGPAPVEVLRDLNLNVAKGEVVALVAPSGAGKSTLLHIAGLLDTPDSGAVMLNGRDMAGLDDRNRTEARRRELGFVYQFHHLLPEFSAAENIILPQLANAVSQRDAEKRAMDFLDRVGLSSRSDHRPAALSGGEQQRVAFCRALANAPSLLLADEPTGNLDPETSDKVFGVLMDLVRETGLSALIATHNLELAKRMDRVIRLTEIRGVMLRSLALAALVVVPAAADPFEDFGTAMKYGLPAVAAVCAARDDRLEDFAIRGILQVAVVYGMKQAFDDWPISHRPSGEGKGFPSGHSAAAAFGAADLAGKCFENEAAAGAVAYGAAGLTAASRVHAGEHTPTQAITGALIGFSFGAASFGIGSQSAHFSVGMKF